MEKIDEYRRIARIAAKSFEGVPDAGERAELEAWAGAVPGRREFLASLGGVDLDERRRRLAHLDRARGWQRVRPRGRVRTLGWAAAAVVAVAVGTLFLLRDNAETVQGVKVVLADGRSVALAEGQRVGAVEHGTGNSLRVVGDAAEAEYSTVMIPRGVDYTLELADGTVARLNAETSMRFSGGGRHVFVEGEACFDVARRDGQPFVVEAGGVRVEVLGTLFNVRAYSDENTVATTLVRGSVRMGDVVLHPDQQGVYDKASGVISTHSVDARAELGWTDNLFVFRNQTVEQIMNCLARWYDLDVVYQADDLRNPRFTGNFDRSADIHEILRMLNETYNIEFTLNNKTITIQRRS